MIGASSHSPRAGEHAIVSSPSSSRLRNAVSSRKARTTAIMTVVVLMVTFGLTLMTGLRPVIPPLAAGAFLFAVLLRENPSLIVHVLLLVNFTARTQGLPRGIRLIGGYFINYNEILILGSLIYAIWLLRQAPLVANRFTQSVAARAALFLSAVIVLGIGIGILHEHPIWDIQYDVRSVIGMMIVVFIAAVIVAVNDWQRYVKTVTTSLIFSAVLMIYASATGMRLAGRTETAQLYAQGGRALAGGSNAIRYLTDATQPAMAVLLGCVALLTFGRIHPLQIMPMLIPSLVISALGFTRSTLLAIAGTFVFAVLLALLDDQVVQLTRRLLLMPIVVGVAVFALLNLGDAVGAHDWIQTQVTGYANRVIAGLEESNRQLDSSAGYREQETEYVMQTGAKSPIVGGGFGQRYKPPTGERGTFFANEGELYSHNVYNWLYVKVGLVGVVAFVALLATSILPALSRYRRNIVLATAAATMVGLSLAMFFTPIPIDEGNSSVVGLVIGLGIGAGTLNVPNRRLAVGHAAFQLRGFG
jgi:hypothetical protein